MAGPCHSFGGKEHLENITIAELLMFFTPLPFSFVIITLKKLVPLVFVKHAVHEAMWLLAFWEKGQLQAKLAILQSLTSF